MGDGHQRAVLESPAEMPGPCQSGVEVLPGDPLPGYRQAYAPALPSRQASLPTK